jgi:hypothetical protein
MPHQSLSSSRGAARPIYLLMLRWKAPFIVIGFIS